MTLLKEVRLMYGLSQGEFAKQLGINVNTYKAYETGRRTIPDKIKIKVLRLRNKRDDRKIADILESAIGELKEIK